MKNVIVIDKALGKTPLQALETYRERHPEYRDIKMTYAGRLDPMASGLLLVLAGDEVHKKDQYLGLDKVYKVDILLGFSTDTYDQLGLVTEQAKENSASEESVIKHILQGFLGKFDQEYPAYSSKTVAGKQLWVSAREGEPVEKPTKNVEIYDISLIGINLISGNKLKEVIISNVSNVSGDFRQDQIAQKWQETLKNVENKEFSVVSIEVSCSSGTYMRSLANKIGQKLGIPALALNIRRIKIGEWRLDK